MTNTQSEQTTSGASRPQWIDDLFASIDARDAQRFASFFTDEGVFYFGNAPGVQGRAAIIEAVVSFFSSIAAVSHQLSIVVCQPDVVVCNGDVSYVRHDGSTITLPFSDTFLMDGERIREYRIYMDINPLYAPA